MAKPGRDELRPFLPTLRERAKQTFPVFFYPLGTKENFHPTGSPGNPVQDALEAIFLNLRVQKGTRKTEGKHVLDALIAGCFEYIDQCYLLKQFQTRPGMKSRFMLG